MTQEVLQFFGLPFDPLVEEFLDTHTKLNIGGVSSTFRDSKTAPFHWKDDLSWEEVSFIYIVIKHFKIDLRISCDFQLIYFFSCFDIIFQCQEIRIA